MCTGTTCGTATNVSVQVAMREPNATDQAVMPDFKLFNNGTTPIPLPEMTLRYWFTRDTAIAQTAWVDFADDRGRQHHAIARRCQPGQDERGLLPAGRIRHGGGEPGGGGNTGNIQARFSKNDFSNYNEANDYSYTASGSFMTTTKVTAYRLGVLVYGTEPP